MASDGNVVLFFHRDPKGSQWIPGGLQEAYFGLFGIILVVFGVLGPSRYRICTDRTPFLLGNKETEKEVSS